jgi:hypothetical protein
VETAAANRSPSSSTQTIGVPGFTNRGYEFCSLQRGVSYEPDFRVCTELTLGGDIGGITNLLKNMMGVVVLINDGLHRRG